MIDQIETGGGSGGNEIDLTGIDNKCHLLVFSKVNNNDYSDRAAIIFDTNLSDPKPQVYTEESFDCDYLWGCYLRCSTFETPIKLHLTGYNNSEDTICKSDSVEVDLSTPKFLLLNIQGVNYG